MMQVREWISGQKNKAMKHIFTVQHTQSIHHTNGMVGSWTDWDLTELGRIQADHTGIKEVKMLVSEIPNNSLTKEIKEIVDIAVKRQ